MFPTTPDPVPEPDDIVVCPTEQCRVVIFLPCDAPRPHRCACPVCHQPGEPARFTVIGPPDIPIGLITPFDIDLATMPTIATIPPNVLN